MDSDLNAIKKILETLIGTEDEKAVLDGVQEYINGRRQDIEATSKK